MEMRKNYGQAAAALTSSVETYPTYGQFYGSKS